MSLCSWIDKKLIAYLNTEVEKKRGYLCDFGRICQEIIPGDVLLVEGHNRTSLMIKNITRSPWTHSALYIGRLHSIDDVALQRVVQKFYKAKPSEQLLVESQLGYGTIVRPVSYYQKHHIRICRPQGLSQRDAQIIIKYAINHLGKQYDRRHVIDLGRYFLANPLIPRRWRSSLFKKRNPEHSTNEICSTLIAEAFAQIRYPIRPTIVKEKKGIKHTERNPNLITPSDFDYSPYFSIIKYPLLGGGHYFDHLNWSENTDAPETQDPND